MIVVYHWEGGSLPVWSQSPPQEIEKRLHNKGRGPGSWLWWILCILLVGVGLTLALVAEANSFIGLYGGTPLIHFGAVDPARPPVVVTGGTQLLVTSPDEPWTLTIEAKGDLVNTTQPERSIPASRLAWAVNNGGPPQWTSFQANTPQIVQGPADPTDEIGTIVRLDYRFSPSWEDPPLAGQYTTDICFTLSPDLDPRQSWVFPTPYWPDGKRVLTIGYWLPGMGPQEVEVTITDTQGEVVREVQTIQLGDQWHEVFWDGIVQTGHFAPPGCYSYRVMVESQTEPIAAGIIEIANGQYTGQGVLQGHVTRGDTGQRLRGAQVTLYTGERRQIASCSTQGDGTYRLDFLPAGEYYLEVSMPGYVATNTELFYLDGHEVRGINICLLPNRALDVDLRLSSKMAVVGDLVSATLRITNSGTRDLLGVVSDIKLPPGLMYVRGLLEQGQGCICAKAEEQEPGSRIMCETGPLTEGQWVQADVWLLVGLDAPYGGARVEAQAIGYGKQEAVETQVVSQILEVTPGPFMATSPRSLVDSHLVLSLSSDVFMEVRVEPDVIAAKTGFFPQDTRLGKRIERNPLLPIAEPLTLTSGWLESHGLRFRLEGSKWAMEAGQWRHVLPQITLPVQEIPVAGLQAAHRVGSVTLQGFYGAPLAWPVSSLYPADNTSGPFLLPKLLPLHHSVNVDIVSWDSIRGVWQKEAPVLSRVDYGKGAITLGRAVSTHNSQGQAQYILVTYLGGPTAKSLRWKEAGLAMDNPNWCLAADYLETGWGDELKLASLRGRVSGSGLTLQGTLQTVLADGLFPWFGSTEGLPQDAGSMPSCQSTWMSRSTWRLVAAVEVYPGLRLGGGWRHEGENYGGFSGIIGQAANRGAATDNQILDRLTLHLDQQLMKTASKGRQGIGPVSSTYRKSSVQAFGLELDLAEGWMTSFSVRKETISARTSLQPDGLLHGWEQRLGFQALGLPHWSFGYGRQNSNSGNSHYGLLEVEGKLQDLDWGAKLVLRQNLNNELTAESGSPVQAVAEVTARYGKGSLKPHIHGRQGVLLANGDARLKAGFEEWAVGIDSEVNDDLKLSVVHTHGRSLEGQGVALDWFGQGIVSQATPGSEALSLIAHYSPLDSWSLKGSGEWISTQKGRPVNPRWQGSLDLEGSLDGVDVGFGWARTPRQGSGHGRQWVDRLSFSIEQNSSAGVWQERSLHLSTSLVGGKAASWEIKGEGQLQMGNLWELWAQATAKMVKQESLGRLLTNQGIIRLSRHMKPELASFMQIGGWQQLSKAELGYSLGLSYELIPGLSLTVGYTWPLCQMGGETGLLSVKPGPFLQLFAH